MTVFGDTWTYLLDGSHWSGEGGMLQLLVQQLLLSITALAELVIARAGSRSKIRSVALHEAYGEDFEDIRRRRPNLARLRSLTGFEHRYTLEQTIDDLIVAERLRTLGEKEGRCTLVYDRGDRVVA